MGSALWRDQRGNLLSNGTITKVGIWWGGGGGKQAEHGRLDDQFVENQWKLGEERMVRIRAKDFFLPTMNTQGSGK